MGDEPNSFGINKCFSVTCDDLEVNMGFLDRNWTNLSFYVIVKIDENIYVDMGELAFVSLDHESDNPFHEDCPLQISFQNNTNEKNTAKAFIDAESYSLQEENKVYV